MSRRSKKRILLVEDDISTALLLQRWLATEGHEVVVAQNAERARAELNRDPDWNLILMDVVLPGRSGLQLLQHLHDNLPGLPTIVMTAERSEEVAETAMDNGALSFLLKPLSRESLLERIRDTFDWLEKVPVVLAFGAEPGVLEASIGGTLLAHQHAGHRMILVALCQDQEQMLEMQRASSESAVTLGAARLLKVVRNKDLNDGTAVRMVRALVEQYHPSWVYVHSPEESEPYRKLVSRTTFEAAEACTNVLAFQGTLSFFHPSTFIDITPYLDNKLQSLRPYAPYFLQQPFLRPDVTRNRAMNCGRSVKMPYAEAFTVLRGRAFEPISELRLSA